MLEVYESDEFSKWLSGLKDVQAKARILKQIQRIQIAEQYVGDWKPVGRGLIEIRLMFGPGYRLYVAMRSSTMLLLLIGGDKSTQAADIAEAQRLLDDWDNQMKNEIEKNETGELDDI